MTDENSYLIDLEGLTPVTDLGLLQIEPGYYGHLMAQPSRESLQKLMRHVLTHQEEARTKGKRGRADLAERFNPDRVAKMVLERLEAVGALDTPVRTGYFTQRAA